MTEQELEKYLKSAFIQPPDSAWLSHARNRMLQKIRASKAERLSVFTALREAVAVYFDHKVFAGLVAAAIVLVMGIEASVELGDALPTNRLYPVKLMVESARGTIAFSSAERAEYDLDRAYARIEELSRLSQATPTRRQTNGEQAAMIARTVERYSQALGSSADAVKQLKAEGRIEETKRLAERLDETARASAALLSVLDSTTTTLLVFKDAKATTAQAQQTAAALLGDSQSETLPSGASATSTPLTSSDAPIDTEEVPADLQTENSDTEASATSTSPSPSPVVPTPMPYIVE
ncbi:MAG: hypothetical protein Q8Q39_04910 [bacterium]|nr:hypothetical protein [bacterium]